MHTDLVFILTFYFAGLLISFIGLPLVFKVFKDFPDKGYPFARTVGILFVSYSLWLAAYIFKLPITSLSCWLLLLALLMPVALFFHCELLCTIRSNCKTILFEEGLFILFFTLMLLYRASNPRIEGIEKFMDFAIINGIYRGQHLPPLDVWFSGYSINYYYFGQFCLAILNKITNIPTTVSYNLNVALIFALTASSAFSINLALTKNKLFALFGAGILVFAGNMDLFYHDLTTGAAPYFYADARSIISNTINEFPAYSFIISDLHAHILNITFVLLFLATIISLALYSTDLLRHKWTLAFLALSFGVLAPTNSWDFFAYLPLLFILPLLNTKKRISTTILTSLVVAAASVILFLFYYINFKSVTNGVGFVTMPDSFLAIVRMFGFFFVAFIAFLIATLGKKHQQTTPVDLLVLTLFLYGFFLILIPEVLFLKDIYFKLNPPYYRANTVFKVWYQAWLVLSLVSAYSSYKLLKSRGFRLLFLPVCLVAVFSVFKYPVVSYKYVIGSTYSYQGLNGADYLSETYAGDAQIISWLNTNVQGQPVLLEAVGNSYTMDSLIASYTGLPTIVGWDEHELGWRDNWPEIALRMGDVEKIYKSESVEEVLPLLRKYHVTYAVITQTEKEKYGEHIGVGLEKVSSPVLTANGAELLKIN